MSDTPLAAYPEPPEETTPPQEVECLLMGRKG
jgi:hypothetical protein